MLVVSFFNTPLGVLKIQHDEHYLYRCEFSSSDQALEQSKSKLVHDITSELTCYFANSSHRFNLSYKLNGTPFQRQVWNALSVIPSGQTITYGQLAHQLQTSPRAVGQACKTNPLPLFIPCHRVVAQHDLGGYMGSNTDIDIKKSLLDHEIKLEVVDI